MTDIRVKIRDGKQQMQLKCPSCEIWGDVDEEQAYGLVSCICPECGAYWITEGEDEINIQVEA